MGEHAQIIKHLNHATSEKRKSVVKHDIPSEFERWVLSWLGYTASAYSVLEPKEQCFLSGLYLSYKPACVHAVPEVTLFSYLSTRYERTLTGWMHMDGESRMRLFVEWLQLVEVASGRFTASLE